MNHSSPKKHLLFIFLDGIGLGADNSEINPLVKANLPCLTNLLDGRTLTLSNSSTQGDRFTLKALDACLGVKGMPQSATGQAVLLTGENVPARLGYHYGPKPNEAISNIIVKENLFTQLPKIHKKPVFLNAYPQRYFDAIQSGRRLFSTIPLAVTSAGQSLNTKNELIRGAAVSADITGQGWHHNLGITDVPLLTPYDAGCLMNALSRNFDFALFEYWLSDYAGHSQEMNTACRILQEVDEMLCGLMSDWDDEQGMVLITSDHGNLEDLGTHRHTNNPVPGLLIGKKEFRDRFTKNLESITDIAPAILDFLDDRNWNH